MLRCEVYSLSFNRTVCIVYLYGKICKRSLLCGGVIYYVSVMYRICVTVTNTRLNALHNQK
jgi:hypothetical protein